VAEWQTRATQNREGNRGGSSPLIGTIFKNRSPLDHYDLKGFFVMFLMDYSHLCYDTVYIYLLINGAEEKEC
uniref:hypothetical protein n=1 Tax=Paenibacillus sinopodophylli TaxID=1837342 RepID=UPI001BB216F0